MRKAGCMLRPEGVLLEHQGCFWVHHQSQNPGERRPGGERGGVSGHRQWLWKSSTLGGICIHFPSHTHFPPPLLCLRLSGEICSLAWRRTNITFQVRIQKVPKFRPIPWIIFNIIKWVMCLKERAPLQNIEKNLLFFMVEDIGTHIHVKMWSVDCFHFLTSTTALVHHIHHSKVCRGPTKRHSLSNLIALKE